MSLFRKPTRLLIFGHDNCGLIDHLAEGFKALGGYKITTAVYEGNAFAPQTTYDYNLRRPQFDGGGFFTHKIPYYRKMLRWVFQKNRFTKQVFFNQDIYIFTWRTLQDNYEDLKKLHEMGKQVVILYIGTDVRWIEAFRQQYPGNSFPGGVEEDWQKKFRFLRMGELYASSIFSVPDQSSLFVRGYFYMFMPISVENIKNSQHNRVKPVVIHAPSRRNIKGTAMILDAIEKLKAEGLEFEFELLEGVRNDLVLKKLENADILVDQVFLNGPATVATEAMAAGCAVATKFFRENAITRDAPICYVDEDCLLPNLRRLITDLAYRKELASKGRDFVVRNNSISVIVMRILESLERDKRADYDILPDFFSDKFKLPPGLKYPADIENLNREVLNKFNNN